MTEQIVLDSSNMVVYIDGEYYPAQLEYHQNDMVDQYVVAVLEYEVEFEPEIRIVIDNDNNK